jgi:hypothetical protein
MKKIEYINVVMATVVLLGGLCWLIAALFSDRRQFPLTNPLTLIAVGLVNLALVFMRVRLAMRKTRSARNRTNGVR